MSDFQQPLDIVNRALQHIRMPRIGAFTDDAAQAIETTFTYGKLRRAELRRNIWRFATRKVALRPLDSGTRFVTPAAYSAATTYEGGALVTYAGGTWVSVKNTNLASTPGTPTTSGAYPWEGYYGPLTAELYDDDTTYHAGELVYTTPGDGTYLVYTSLVEGNENDPEAVDEWDENTTYGSGDVVSYNSTNYQSRVALNLDHQPDTSATQWTSTVTNPAVSGSWRKLTSATLSSYPIVYPLTAGPANQSITANAFRLPSNYLREAPQEPKAGVFSYLGGPSNLWPDDWRYEGNFIVSGISDPLLYRFVADIQDVTAMDDMFCEGLACRIAMETGPILTPSKWNALEPGIVRAYKDLMSDARMVNGIEIGAIETPEDTYITCRQ